MRATKGGKKKELLNTSEIARRSGLNRATVRGKLEEKGVKPKQEKSKEKLYDLDEVEKALGGDEGRSSLRKAQTMKTAVEAARVKIKLEKERGEVVPIDEVRGDLQEIVRRIFQHFAVNSPRELAQKLRGLRPPQIEALLKRNAEQFFSELRAEYEGYL